MPTQHNINTVVGLDRKKTVQTPPHHRNSTIAFKQCYNIDIYNSLNLNNNNININNKINSFRSLRLTYIEHNWI